MGLDSTGLIVRGGSTQVLEVRITVWEGRESLIQSPGGHHSERLEPCDMWAECEVAFPGLDIAYASLRCCTGRRVVVGGHQEQS